MRATRFFTFGPSDGKRKNRSDGHRDVCILTRVLSKNQPVVHLCTVLDVEMERGLIVLNYEGQFVKQ
jgi:hypothetical protein